MEREQHDLFDYLNSNQLPWGMDISDFMAPSSLHGADAL